MGAAEGVLAGVFASILIPKDIGQIRFEDYKILRERLKGCRHAFARLLNEYTQIARLDKIQNTTVIQKKIEELAKI